MSKSHGSVAPKERVNIKYVPATGDQQAEVELPLKLLITGDFKGHGELTALEDRQAVRIDKDTFNEVLTKAEVALDMAVPSVLNNDPPSTGIEQVAGTARSPGCAQRPDGQCPGLSQTPAKPAD